MDQIRRIDAPHREVRLSHLRQVRKTTKKKDWTSDNLKVIPEPTDGYLAEDKREVRMSKKFNYTQKEKARFDMEKTLGDVITTDEFLSKDKAVVTDDNSNVLSSAEIKNKEEPGRISNAPAALMMDEENNLVEGQPATLGDLIKANLGMKTKTAGMTATIGTFNIEWLGQKKRSEEDYKAIAQVIKDSGAEVLGIQEVAKLDGLRRVMKYLPDYGYILGKSGQQMVGVLFDKNRVKYDANSIDQLDDVTLGQQGLRPPLSVDMKVDNFDFNMVVMHLKARFDPRSIEIRRRQAEAVRKWLGEHQKSHEDKDVIIVGDYNDFVGSEALNIIDRGDAVHYATEEAAEKDIYSNIRYKSVIDHGALSNEEGGATEEYVQGSLRTVDENKYKSYLHKVSDHKPIVFEVRSDKDND